MQRCRPVSYTHLAYFEYIITDSELEALVLECNLIKEHRPHYNTMLKDDKSCLLYTSIEVMGRNAGYIALWCGIASGAEDILIPERFDGNRPKLEMCIRDRLRIKSFKDITKADTIAIGDPESVPACLLYTSRCV